MGVSIQQREEADTRIVSSSSTRVRPGRAVTAGNSPAYQRKLAQNFGLDSRIVGARKRTRTSKAVRPLEPESSASASSAIRALIRRDAVAKSHPHRVARRFNSAEPLRLCQRNETKSARRFDFRFDQD